jgi:hypothetical protein
MLAENKPSKADQDNCLRRDDALITKVYGLGCSGYRLFFVFSVFHVLMVVGT